MDAIIILLLMFMSVLKGEDTVFSDKSRKLKNKIAENEEIEDHIDKRKKEVFENEKSLEQEDCCI